MATEMKKSAARRAVKKSSAQATPRRAERAPRERPAPVEENKLGQQRGAKGTRTRAAIMDATTALLSDRRLGAMRITDIAREAGIAQPNFYTYFSSVEEVIQAIAQEITADELAVFVEETWLDGDGLDRARAFVKAALEFWGEHGVILHHVFALADRGLLQFADLRIRTMRKIYKGIEARVREAQAEGRVAPEVNPRLVGYECVSLIAQVSARHVLFAESGFSRAQLIETTSRILMAIITGDGRD